jgi:hypothetical protein
MRNGASQWRFPGSSARHLHAGCLLLAKYENSENPSAFRNGGGTIAVPFRPKRRREIGLV